MIVILQCCFCSEKKKINWIQKVCKLKINDIYQNLFDSVQVYCVPVNKSFMLQLMVAGEVSSSSDDDSDSEDSEENGEVSETGSLSSSDKDSKPQKKKRKKKEKKKKKKKHKSKDPESDSRGKRKHSHRSRSRSVPQWTAVWGCIQSFVVLTWMCYDIESRNLDSVQLVMTKCLIWCPDRISVLAVWCFSSSKLHVFPLYTYTERAANGRRVVYGCFSFTTKLRKENNSCVYIVSHALLIIWRCLSQS